MRKKVWFTLVVAAVAAVTAFTAFGCNKFTDNAPALSDIYRNYDATQGEIDTAELGLVLPEGWQVLSSASGANADSDIGYIASMNAFIVVNGYGDLSVVKVPEGEDKTVTEEDLIIPPSVGVRAIKAAGNFFAVRVASSSGFVGVMDSEGKWRVNADKTRSTGEEISTAARAASRKRVLVCSESISLVSMKNGMPERRNALLSSALYPSTSETTTSKSRYLPPARTLETISRMRKSISSVRVRAATRRTFPAHSVLSSGGS